MQKELRISGRYWTALNQPITSFRPDLINLNHYVQSPNAFNKNTQAYQFICLFIYGLFSDAVSSSDNIASKHIYHCAVLKLLN
jgi:hypothetical protein